MIHNNQLDDDYLYGKLEKLFFFFQFRRRTNPRWKIHHRDDNNDIQILSDQEKKFLT